MLPRRKGFHPQHLGGSNSDDQTGNKERYGGRAANDMEEKDDENRCVQSATSRLREKDTPSFVHTE